MSDISQFEDRLENIEGLVVQVRDCLVGNEFTKKGLVDDMAEMKRKIAIHELFIKNTKFILWFAGGAGGVIGYFVNLLMQYLSFKK